jgi:hypothetical protein
MSEELRQTVIEASIQHADDYFAEDSRAIDKIDHTSEAVSAILRTGTSSVLERHLPRGLGRHPKSLPSFYRRLQVTSRLQADRRRG